MARDQDWLKELGVTVGRREGAWRLWTPPLDNQEGPARYYLQRKRMEMGPGGKQAVWRSEPEDGFATLDDVGAYLGVPPESTYTKETE